MKFISLVFDYNLTKILESGRIWGKDGYKNKQFIFDYSAASIASVLHMNPHIRYEIYTDDVALLDECISAYNVDSRNLIIIDHSKKIAEWSEHRYCFWPAVKFFDEHVCEGVIKLDNDLTCKKPVDDLLKFEGALVWKYERECKDGRHYWGESYVASRTLGTTSFSIFNIGVFALSSMYVKTVAHELPELTSRLIDVDASEVIRFSENSSLRSSMWSYSEQTADSFLLHKYKIPVTQTTEWFDHHCYSLSRQTCIDAVRHLKKSS